MFQKQAGGIELLDAREILEDHAKLGYGEKVGALGCGPKAYFTFQAARIVGDKGTVYAVDILKDVLSSVESHAKTDAFANIKTIWSNLETYGATNIPESSLDLAMLINVLFESTDIASMLKEAVRLIKPDGKILVIDWKNIGVPFGPKIDRRVNVLQVKEYLEVFGLKLQEEFEAGKYHFGMIYKK
jgi:ubiquinone/menaquinone biosynthesis C-methylase UbiE